MVFPEAFPRPSTVVTTGALALSLVLAACAGSQEKPAPPTAQQQEMARLANERDIYVQQTTARLDRYSAFTDTLRTRAAKQPKALSRDMVQAANRMQTILGDAWRELEELRVAAPENWVPQRPGVEREVLRAEAAYSEAVKLIR